MNAPRAVGWMAVLAGLCCAPGIRAAGVPPIVRVYVAGPPEAVSGSRDAIQDRCARSNVAVVVRDAAGADEALLAGSRAPGLAEAYVDLRPGSAPRVVVVDGQTRRDLERRVLPEAASLEIAIETTAHVVCAAVESSLAARAEPASLSAAPSAFASRDSGSPPAADWRSRLSLFASAVDFGAGFRGGAGAGFAVTRRVAPLRAGLELGLLGYPSSDIEAAGGLASFGSLGARLMPLVEWQVTSQLTGFAGIGAGFDWTRIEAGRPPPGAMAGGARTTIDATASAMIGVRWRVAGGAALLLGFDLDLALSRHRYVTQTPDGVKSFFEPARLRPMALAGLSFELGAAPATNATRPQGASR